MVGGTHADAPTHASRSRKAPTRLSIFSRGGKRCEKDSSSERRCVAPRAGEPRARELPDPEEARGEQARGA
eukprot:CAMPEP_0183358310 /NCGR_PEP_ID=MMETSP0164_2-20130417/48834_1 /TAXON_ID=221442 /ORGANISM="Coccolithus pelagicus ssp braarudi, Strain PLY182g" /LENGTH=70 /DNA_ID=CAMNT_0025532179 /DNA_START=148 /DNA_END=356 /DNA_ORIENTATION=+